MSTDLELSIASYVLDRRAAQPSYPLQIVARRYTSPALLVPADDTTAPTLLLVCAVGQTSELWIPTLRRLFSLVRLRAVWAVDAPNHGDAAHLNATILAAQYADIFPIAMFGRAIRLVIDELLTETDRKTLIAVGHSAGGGALMHTFLSPDDPLPFKEIIFVEPPFFSETARPAFSKLATLNRMHTAKQRASWPSLDTALADLTRQAPARGARGFHASVLPFFSETQLIAEGEGVALKTSPSNASAGFVDVPALYGCIERSASVIRRIPGHFILGARADYWPKPIARELKEAVDEHRAHIASLRMVEGASHFPPMENPEGTADALAAALGGGSKGTNAKL